MFGKRRIYLDHASTTPVDRRVMRVMKPYFSRDFSNPGALCVGGRNAKKAITAARKSVAVILGVRAEEIFFTGSGTEANNLALLGVIRAAKRASPEKTPHIVTCSIEHSSVLEVCKQIEREGGKVTVVPVGENGIVSLQEIEAALRPETVLVSVMYANNEIGTIQPIHDISRAIRRFEKKSGAKILFHTDASQAANYLTLRADSLGVDMMTLDASKIYGPKGVGILFKKHTVALSPIIFGGGQEGGLRSGTENVPGIVGAAKALEIAQSIREKESARLVPLRDFFITELLKRFPKATLNGDEKKRLPNNVNICFPGTFSEFSVVKLDLAGISCSSASACTTATGDSASHVIAAVGKKDCAGASLRFTFGRGTTKGKVKRALRRIDNTLN